MDNLWMLFAAAGVMVAIIGGLALLGDHYTLNNIKSKTVGDGQHGTARWATDAEIRKTYGLTPEEAAVQFFKYCADPKTQDHAITLLKRWKEEQEAQERNSTNAK